MNETPSPIAQLDRQAISFVTVEPMLVNGAWVELRGDGNEIAIRTTGPTGFLRPSGPCILEHDAASTLVETLARARGFEPARESQLGDYTIRIGTISAGELAARLLIGQPPGPRQVPAVAVGDHQYRLEMSDFFGVQRLIAGARC